MKNHLVATEFLLRDSKQKKIHFIFPGSSEVIQLNEIVPEIYFAARYK